MNEVNERRFPTLRPFDYLIGMQLITDLILLVLNIIPHLEFGLGAYLQRRDA
jgi:hypothetical protein